MEILLFILYLFALYRLWLMLSALALHAVLIVSTAMKYGRIPLIGLHVAGLVLLTLNTIFCSIQSVRGKWSRSDFLLRISPQVIHIGFLFILLAHLLGAGWGYKLSGMMPEGAYAPLPEDLALRLNKIHVQTDALGFMTDWSIEASLYENNHLVRSGTLGPNSPFFTEGLGFISRA
jgi:hypothetical protein